MKWMKKYRVMTDIGLVEIYKFPFGLGWLARMANRKVMRRKVMENQRRPMVIELKCTKSTEDDAANLVESQTQLMRQMFLNADANLRERSQLNEIRGYGREVR